MDLKLASLEMAQAIYKNDKRIFYRKCKHCLITAIICYLIAVTFIYLTAASVNPYARVSSAYYPSPDYKLMQKAINANQEADNYEQDHRQRQDAYDAETARFVQPKIRCAILLIVVTTSLLIYQFWRCYRFYISNEVYLCTGKCIGREITDRGEGPASYRFVFQMEDERLFELNQYVQCDLWDTMLFVATQQGRVDEIPYRLCNRWNLDL